MTTEEKARAYDEAIERAKEVIRKMNMYDGTCIKEDIEDIFPQLAESEDERTRKEIIEFIRSQIEDGNSAGWDRWIAYLEKQKENPKSADSIPSDCVSDAKCEDGWHKVEDSLPDNPREVLCKDEARNYFIGRYYVGEGWEISIYDDEDKPHHLNPPVSKWIDFPSEKKKEQRDYHKLYEDIAKSKWFKQNYVGKSLGGDEEQKEQKTAQTDDEKEYIRTLKNLISAFVYDKQPQDVVYYQHVYDWLEERHVEQKPAEWSDTNELVFKDICKHLKEEGYNGWIVLLEALRNGEFQPKQEWSEEDERAINCACVALRAYAHGDLPEFLPSELMGYADRLQSLRFDSYKNCNSRWKPSEEQMEAFRSYIKDFQEKAEAAVGGWNNFDVMIRLFEQLKKL